MWWPHSLRSTKNHFSGGMLIKAIGVRVGRSRVLTHWVLKDSSYCTSDQLAACTFMRWAVEVSSDPRLPRHFGGTARTMAQPLRRREAPSSSQSGDSPSSLLPLEKYTSLLREGRWALKFKESYCPMVLLEDEPLWQEDSSTCCSIAGISR